MTSDQDANQIATSLDRINFSKQYEVNLRDVLKYRLKALTQNRKWTETELEDLESIADQCYKCVGHAIKIARVLLGKNRWDYDDEKLYESKAVFRSNTRNINPEINLHPNPCNGNFEINIVDKFYSGKCMIFNSIGQLIQSDPFDKNENTLKISINQEPGIYFVKIILDANKVYTDKIEIIK